MEIVRGRKSWFANLANLEALANVFLHFLFWPGFLYKMARIAKVFSRTMAKKVFRETFLPRMIPVIRYSAVYPGRIREY